MKKKHKSIWLRFDRVLAHDLLKQALILVVLFAVLFVVSYVLLSFSNLEWREFCRSHNLSKWLLPLYLLIDTNALNNLYINDSVHGWMLFASSLTYLAGLFVFNGMIISVMTNAISSRVERHQNGLIHYFKSGHIVIMGYDDIVPSIISDIFARNNDPDILILTSANPVQINEKLKRTIGKENLKRIIVNYGHRTSPDEYSAIHLEAAEEIFIVGCRQLPAHDAINIECLESICNYFSGLDQQKRSNLPIRITCVFEDFDTYTAFKQSEIFDTVNQLVKEFVPYNFYTGWAKKIFIDKCSIDHANPQNNIHYPAVFGSGITEDDDRYVHIVFVGTTYFAVAFAMEAAQVLHFPNFNKNKNLRTVITFIDLHADTERNIFQTRNRQFFKSQPMVYSDLSKKDGERGTVHGSNGYLDVEFEFIKGDIFSDTVQNKLCDWAKDKKQYLSLFLAMSNQRNNFAIGMNMPDEIYDNQVPIFIRQDRSGVFITNLRTADKEEYPYYRVNEQGELEDERRRRNRRYAYIYPFGMTDTGYCSDGDVSFLRAKLINYLYCTADYTTNKFQDLLVLNSMPVNMIFGTADMEWNKLTVANKWSNLYGAYSFSCKLATLRAMRGLEPDDTSLDMQPLNDDEIQTLAEMEHNRWNVEKLLMGFRKPLPEEDKYLHPKFGKQLKDNKKLFIHSDIRPYKELPEETKQLDREFSKYIPWILKMTLPR